ncbi:MAG: hypothetical protein HUU21_32570 [Polyangiaceae bacterium]|nr:hypothetical protein [Polyangiaceae bacterium]NUQ78288.1 hypothetical protein [Polyangiaceae bacterium]
MPLDKKLEILNGTVAVDEDAVEGKTIILIEDLYQSGSTINHVAMEVLHGGASAIFGLSCVKTCRNTDNQ